MSRLFVVATPIGNLRDITLRALEVLRSVGHIAAEDTRHTAKLLHHYEISTPLVSYHEHNQRRQLPRILALLAQGDVALVSDAGTPGINDPGAELIVAADAVGHKVVPLPGPSALSAVLSIAGFGPGPVHFLGFLPRKSKARRDLIECYAALPGVTAFFETPHRLHATLADIAAVAGAQQLVVGRELTKLHEEIVRGPATEVAARFAAGQPRGEFVLVLRGTGDDGGPPEVRETAPKTLKQDDAALAQRFATLCDTLGDRRQALAQLVTETGQPRREVYRRLHQ
ncbi:MAG: 16S rRNA (cytidine(1402)-2'-O)-methyltransferase [Dehalococcoidia bacterium]|nr:16S rRNA (cytidine(1402)-2'-O)-methyltransferase [Dehalococcoidia bacterium]